MYLPRKKRHLKPKVCSIISRITARPTATFDYLISRPLGKVQIRSESNQYYRSYQAYTRPNRNGAPVDAFDDL